MKLVRFMSRVELLKYQGGYTICNPSVWRIGGWRSSSVGVCFFDDTEPPEERLRYASGVVDSEICAVFETVPFARIQPAESEGVYRDPDNDLPTLEELFTMDLKKLKCRHVREWCLPEYDKSILKLIRVGYPVRHKIGWQIYWEAENGVQADKFQE